MISHKRKCINRIMTGFKHLVCGGRFHLCLLSAGASDCKKLHFGGGVYVLYALHDLNCVVGSKEKIGIVGRTRAGKSSLKTYRKNELQGEGYYEQGRSTLIILAKNRDQFSIHYVSFQMPQKVITYLSLYAS